MRPTALAVLLLSACTSPPPAAREAAIIGGVPDNGDPAVVLLDYGWWCSGSLVTPRVVLTAAHCVYDAVEGGFADSGSIYFYSSWNTTVRTVAVLDARYHRDYDPERVGRADIALVLLSEAVTDVPLIPLGDQALEDLLTTGSTLRAVGFGIDDPVNDTGAGYKRQVSLPVYSVAAEHLIVGDADATTCFGDSGGPILMVQDGVEHVVGVNSYTRGCAGAGTSMRVDAYLDTFLIQAIDAWDGPCPLDGICTESGCRTADPDCDPCGWQGVCGDPCPSPDWDCPPGLGYLEPCAVDTDCEARECAVAADDDRIRYCTRSCDVDADARQACGEWMECDDAVSPPLCHYTEPTPGTTGAFCNDAGDCASGLCDVPARACVEACGAADACGGGSVCADVEGGRGCTTVDDGFCAAAPGRRADVAGLLALLAAIGLVARRRRGRPGVGSN